MNRRPNLRGPYTATDGRGRRKIYRGRGTRGGRRQPTPFVKRGSLGHTAEGLDSGVDGAVRAARARSYPGIAFLRVTLSAGLAEREPPEGEGERHKVCGAFVDNCALAIYVNVRIFFGFLVRIAPLGPWSRSVFTYI